MKKRPLPVMVIKSETEPYFNPEELMQKANLSCGGVLGLVFNYDLAVKSSVDLDAANKLLENDAGPHTRKKTGAWCTILHDLLFGLVSEPFVEFLKLDPRHKIELEHVRGSTTNGGTKGEPKTVPRYRYWYYRQPGDPKLLIDKVGMRISKETLELFREYVRTRVQTKSENARRLPPHRHEEEEE